MATPLLLLLLVLMLLLLVLLLLLPRTPVRPEWKAAKAAGEGEVKAEVAAKKEVGRAVKKAAAVVVKSRRKKAKKGLRYKNG